MAEVHQFEDQLLQGMTAVIVTIGKSYFYDPSESMQPAGFVPWLAAKRRMSSFKGSSREFSKKYKSVKAVSIHTNWTGGGLFP